MTKFKMIGNAPPKLIMYTEPEESLVSTTSGLESTIQAIADALESARSQVAAIQSNPLCSSEHATKLALQDARGIVYRVLDKIETELLKITGAIKGEEKEERK